ncbi:response regulator [Methanoregula sp.]|uniref:ATP-binding response regulator n=1 Tax=Methanoregula sp. TaxID=2052170 RepID=UPI003563EBFB
MGKYSILIVEDDLIVAEDLKMTFTNLGYDISAIANTGELAIELARSRSPDLILMDIMLAGKIDGITTAEQISERLDIPVIYITAYVNETLLQRAKLTSPYGYIIKPFNDRELQATVEMVLYKHTLDRKLKKSEENYHTIFDNAVMGIYQVSLEGRFLSANNHAARILGYASAEELIQSITDINTQIYQDPKTREVAKRIFLEKGVLENFEVPCRHKNGQIVWVSINARLVRDAEGAILYLEGTSQNITQRKRVEDALAVANKKLTLFTSITRHDINNQLAVVQGYLSILEKKQTDPTLNNYFGKMSTAAKRIFTIIQFTKEYESLGVNVPAWQNCRSLVDTVAKQVPLGQVIVKNDLPTGTEVFADPLITKVIYNLIDNALRYGGNQMKTICISSQESDASLTILCEDNGVGITAENKKHLFTMGFGKNTGFGLFLSSEILAITSITITENGTPGKGARFEITVPKGMWRTAGDGA